MSISAKQKITLFSIDKIIMGCLHVHNVYDILFLEKLILKSMKITHDQNIKYKKAKIM